MDVSFTFSTISTPGMRPRSTWVVFWILGVLVCEGLGKLLWPGGVPASFPVLLTAIPRSVVVGLALGAWQALMLYRWVKGGGDWWLPTLIGVLVGNVLISHPFIDWPSAPWLPSAALAGIVTGFGQWLVLKQGLRRSVLWLLVVPFAKVAAAAIAAFSPIIATSLASLPGGQVLIARGVAVVGIVLMDGCLEGAVLQAMLGPGDRRGPQLKLSS